jgi:hypothetical protein
MNTDRLEQLKQYLIEEPDDPFNIYCLANEYKNHNHEKALEYYNELLNNHSKYLPTYYHSAELYITLNELNKAEKIIKNGILLATEQADQLALRELKNLQNNLFEF